MPRSGSPTSYTGFLKPRSPTRSPWTEVMLPSHTKCLVQLRPALGEKASTPRQIPLQPLIQRQLDLTRLPLPRIPSVQAHPPLGFLKPRSPTRSPWTEVMLPSHTKCLVQLRPALGEKASTPRQIVMQPLIQRQLDLTRGLPIPRIPSVQAHPPLGFLKPRSPLRRFSHATFPLSSLSLPRGFHASGDPLTST
jgi:hypothetical protein